MSSSSSTGFTSGQLIVPQSHSPLEKKECRVKAALQRTSTENGKTNVPRKKLLGHSPNFHIHGPVSDLDIPTIDLPILLQEICGPTLGIYKSLTDT
jgi:hypothetical protein